MGGGGKRRFFGMAEAPVTCWLFFQAVSIDSSSVAWTRDISSFDKVYEEPIGPGSFFPGHPKRQAEQVIGLEGVEFLILIHNGSDPQRRSTHRDPVLLQNVQASDSDLRILSNFDSESVMVWQYYSWCLTF